MKIIVVANQKGGVAKTATAGALLCALKRKGYSVLGIDMDPQANLTDNLGGKMSDHSMYSVLKGKEGIRDIIQDTPLCKLAPATILLAGIEQELNRTGRECRLKEAIEEADFKDEYDFLIIDTPPALGTITINALVAADYVVIPTMADMASVKGIDQLNDTICNVRKYFNKSLQIAGILFTRFDERTRMARGMMNTTAQIADHIGTKVFGRPIRASVVIPETNAMATDLWTFNAKSNVALDYENFAEELVKEVE